MLALVFLLAADAGVAAAMTLKVTKMGYAGWNGVAPLIAYSADEDIVVTRVGAGTAPRAATLDYFLEHGKTATNTALVPADVDVWLAALDRFGSFSFARASAAALDAAEQGYLMHKMQKWLLDTQTEQAMRFPYNVQFWFPNGVGRQRVGDLMVNRDLGRLIKYMVDAERQALAGGGTRSDGLLNHRFQLDSCRLVNHRADPGFLGSRISTEVLGGDRH